MSIRNWILLLVTSSTFASSLLFNHILVENIPPVTLSFLRAVIALPMAYAAMRLYGRALPRSVGQWMPTLYAGVLLVAIPFGAIAWGQQYIPSGLGGILYSTMPLFTIIFAQFLTTDELICANKIIGIAIGVVGVTVVVGPSVLLGGLQSEVQGQVVTLLGPVSYALGTVYARRNKHLHPLTLTTGMFLAASVILLPIAFFFEDPLAAHVDQSVIITLVGLAFIGTVIPALFNYMLIQRVGATNTSLVMFFMPSFAVLYGYLILDEVLTAHYYLGMLLVVAGSLLVTQWQKFSGKGLV